MKKILSKNIILFSPRLHCKDTIPKIINKFPEKELRGLSPNFHIHEPVNDLDIPTIGLPILLQKNMLTDPGNI